MTTELQSGWKMVCQKSGTKLHWQCWLTEEKYKTISIVILQTGRESGFTEATGIDFDLPKTGGRKATFISIFRGHKTLKLIKYCFTHFFLI